MKFNNFIFKISMTLLADKFSPGEPIYYQFQSKRV